MTVLVSAASKHGSTAEIATAVARVLQERRLAEVQAGALASRPVWLFSSGPVGDPPKPEENPVDVSALLEQTGARDHRVFAGKIDKHGLGLAEKAIEDAVVARAR